MSDTTRGDKILQLLEDNEDIIRKAHGRVSQYVSFEDILSDCFIRMLKHFDLEKDHPFQIRQYLSMVAYQVSTANLKMCSPNTRLVSKCTTGSVRNRTYEELAKLQEEAVSSLGHDPSSRYTATASKNDHEDNVDLIETLETQLNGPELEVANLLCLGHNMSEISRMTGIAYPTVRTKIIPNIKSRVGHILTGSSDS